MFTAHCYPSSNGQAEWTVCTFKEALKKTKTNMEKQLLNARFLFTFMTTPHSTTETPPVELMFK